MPLRKPLGRPRRRLSDDVDAFHAHAIDKDARFGLHGRDGAFCIGRYRLEGEVVNTALQAQYLTWSDQTLDAWLSGPRQFIPGAAMPVRSEAKARPDP